MSASSRPVLPPEFLGTTDQSPEFPRDAPATATGDSNVVLDVRNLRTYFFTYDGVVKALDGVTFKLRRGETTGLVGETGCGKSVTAFSITRLIGDPPGRVMSGNVYYRGIDLLWGLDEEAKYKPIPKSNRVKVKRSFRKIKAAMERMSAVRGSGISTIFQEPSSAMNPIFQVSDQIGEALTLHQGLSIIDGLLAATPDAPEVGPAIDALIAAAIGGKREEVRAAAVRLGEAAHISSFATEAFYIVRGPGTAAGETRPDLVAALGRFRLNPLQRAFLRSQRRLVELRGEEHQLYLEEMRAGALQRGKHRAISARRSRERLSHFYYGIWGIRSRARHPMKQETFWRTVRLLEGVSIANPVQVAKGYPHELSGGMLQRVMIAMALSSEPDILIADEPTTALDVTIQAQILELMRDLKTRVGTAILLITHDLAVIAEVADRVCVMYAGLIVESAPVRELFQRPLHPYAQGLLASIPRLDQPDKELTSIPGSVPNLITPPTGCRFHPRCPYAMPVCKEQAPPTTLEGTDHEVACYLYKGPVVAE
jgi:oligopeptide/dipeptide ABC transporter ATP-binding protein